MTALYEAALVNALALHVIPNLPDVTQIPEASWVGWEPIFTELGVDKSNEQFVQETVARCQTMLQQLLQAALNSGQDDTGLGAVATQQEAAQPVDVAQAGVQATAATQGTEAQVTASQMQLTQLVGSAGEQPVLLNQPKAHIIARARLPRGERLEIWYQLAFEGYPESEAEWFPANRIRSEYPQGDELIQNFERNMESSGQQDSQLPPGVGAGVPDGSQVQLPGVLPLAVAPPGSEGLALPGGDAAAATAAAADTVGQQQFTAAGQEQVAVGAKRGREEGVQEGDDPNKRQRPEDAAAAAAIAAGQDSAAAAAAAAAAAEATSAGMAAQLGAGGQLFAMAGADGQPMLQVVPLQMPAQLDANGMGQLGHIDLTQLDPQMLQALSLQGMQVGNMQQLVLHMPAGAAAGSHPMLAAATLGQHGLQLAMPHMQMHAGPAQHHPGREHIIAHIKEAIKLLMHSSEELQRKKRQQSRRSELNQRRALLLPDGSAAPGALPTTAAGTPAPPPVRPTNMLAAIQALPPAEKRAMLMSALRRALPVMMQTAQVANGNIANRQPTNTEAAMAAAANDEAMLQYQQLLAQQGMQVIAVPLQGGMQGLMQMPLSAEQLQQMGPLTLDANGQLQGLPPGMMLADPATMASMGMGMLTPEQLQQMGLQPGDPAVAGLDPAAMAAAAAAAAGMAVPGQELGQGMQAMLDPAAAAAAAAAAAGQHLAFDPATLAAMAAAAAATSQPAEGVQPAETGMLTADADPAAVAATAVAEQAGQVPTDPAAGAAAEHGTSVQGVHDPAAMAAATAPQPADAAADPAAAAAAPATMPDGTVSTAAVEPAAGGGGGGAAGAGPAKREAEAILAAISLTSLSRMPGPEDGGSDAAAADPAAAAAAAPAAATAVVPDGGTAGEASQQLANSVIMQAAGPMPVTPAEQLTGDAAMAAAMQAAAELPAVQQGHDAAAAAGLDHMHHDHLQQHFEVDKHQQHFMQLPPHLAGMQPVLDGLNPELLNPQLQTQDFAPAHMPGAEGTA